MREDCWMPWTRPAAYRHGEAANNLNSITYFVLLIARMRKLVASGSHEERTKVTGGELVDQPCGMQRKELAW
jgi:hypothetical protein